MVGIDIYIAQRVKEAEEELREHMIRRAIKCITVGVIDIRDNHTYGDKNKEFDNNESD